MNHIAAANLPEARAWRSFFTMCREYAAIVEDRRRERDARVSDAETEPGEPLNARQPPFAGRL